LADAHGVEPAGEGLLAGLVERLDDFRGILLAEAAGIDVVAEVELGELIFVEFEEIKGGGA